MIGYAVRANLIGKSSLTALPQALATYKPAFVVY